MSSSAVQPARKQLGLLKFVSVALDGIVAPEYRQPVKGGSDCNGFRLTSLPGVRAETRTLASSSVLSKPSASRLSILSRTMSLSVSTDLSCAAFATVRSSADLGPLASQASGDSPGSGSQMAYSLLSVQRLNVPPHIATYVFWVSQSAHEAVRFQGSSIRTMRAAG